MVFWDNLMGSVEGATNYMETYGEGSGFQTRHTIGSFINDDETVLDVGCGPGWNYLHFITYGPEVTYKGIDYSSFMIKGAKDKFPKAIFEVGDVRDIKEPDSSWDVVILQDVLEHTNGYKKPVSEALRVAIKRVIISFWHLEGNEGTEHINDDGDDGWGAWYDQIKWEEFLNSLPYVWHHLDIHPDGKTHSWNFYILDKENS